MEGNKRILDSVHGYIRVRDLLFKYIIDTPNFQRLRRIEQTSARALFPCAHHDRFVHSLGVFHLGQKILQALGYSVEQLYSHIANSEEQTKKKRIALSYSVACLLHDVGHSPFSHTFEQYFDNQDHNLMDMLKHEVNNDNFSADADYYIREAAPHEIMSAYVTLKVYKVSLDRISVDTELVTRMIIGCKYHVEEVQHSLENAFIDLIHGDIIDADGIDYVCRDAWASGYSTAQVDIDRLIESIVLQKDEHHQYQVCYTPKALNEIEAVLSVKTFQQTNVITHHTVVYEQHLLVKAMESAALHHFSMDYTEDESVRDDALSKLCNVEALLGIVILPRHQIPYLYPMDDDFVSLMKYIPNDRYVKQWFGRQYELKPLWKSKAEFYEYFPILTKTIYTKQFWLFGDECKNYICQQLNVAHLDVWILDAQDKYKGNNASKVKMLVNGKIIPYTNLFPKDKNTYVPSIQPFFYIYVPKSIPQSKIDHLIIGLQSKVQQYAFTPLMG